MLRLSYGAVVRMIAVGQRMRNQHCLLNAQRIDARHLLEELSHAAAAEILAGLLDMSEAGVDDEPRLRVLAENAIQVGGARLFARVAGTGVFHIVCDDLEAELERRAYHLAI